MYHNSLHRFMTEGQHVTNMMSAEDLEEALTIQPKRTGTVEVVDAACGVYIRRKPVTTTAS